MARSRMLKKQPRVVGEPMGRELADWFYGHSNEDILAHSLIADQIEKMLRARGKWKPHDKVKYELYRGLIDDARTWMIGQYRLTLKNIRQTKSVEGGYKVADDAEATHIGEQRLRRFGLAGRRAIEMIPLMKKEFLSRPIKQIFAETIHEIKEVKSTWENYLLKYDEGEKERREAERQLLTQEKADAK